MSGFSAHDGCTAATAQQCVRVILSSSTQIKKIIEECTGTFLFAKSEIEGAKSPGDRSYIIW